MSVLFAIALTTGVLSGLWMWVSVSLGLLSWAGFLGCTTYFASPREGLAGLAEGVLTNTTGVFWAVMILRGGAFMELEIVGYILTAVVSFLMCMQARMAWLSFIPGTFIGCSATFASGGQWQLVLPSLLVGVMFGYAMKSSGLWLNARMGQKQESTC